MTSPVPKLGALLDEALTLALRARGALLGAMVIVYAPATLLLLGGIELATRAVVNLAADQFEVLTTFVVILAAVAVGVVVDVVALSLAGVLVARVVAATVRGSTSRLRDALAGSPAHLTAALPFALVAGLALTTLVFGPVGAVGLFFAAQARVDAGTAWLLVVLLLGGFLVGLAGLAFFAVLTVRFGLALPMLASERVSLRTALTRAREAARPHAGLVFGVLATVVMIALFLGALASSAVPSPSFEEATLMELKARLPALGRAQLASTAVGHAVALVTHAFGLVTWTVLYRHLASGDARDP